MPLSRMDYILIFTTICFLIQTASANNPCCPGDNRIINKKCADGSSLTALRCPHKYITGKNEDLTVNDKNHLIIASSHIPPDRYCDTNMNNTHVYIVCFSENVDMKEKMFVINAILELISVFFLLITIAVYLQLPDLLDLQGICILHSISGLAISFLALAINQLTSSAIEKKLCLAYAYITYFSMLYSFFWLNILSFHIWRTTVKPRFLRSNKYWSYIYHGFGIGGPTALLLLLIIMASSMQYSDMHPGFGETKCWFKSTKSQFIYFYGPMAILLCLNIVYFGWTITILWKDITALDQKKAKVLKYRLILCVKLFFIMGISWIFELLSAAFQDIHPILEVCWSITDCLNTLQGILIFVILVVLRKRVVRSLANRSFCGIRLPSRWRTVADDECEEIEEEFGLSEAQQQKS